MISEKDRLICIKDLASYDKKLMREVTISNRIAALAEDMNLIPSNMRGELSLGGSSRRTHVFHASTIGSDTGNSLCGKYPMGCGRQLYYDYVGEKSEDSIDPRLRRIFDTGSAIHVQLQLYLAEYAKRNCNTDKFEAESDINPDVNDVADQFDISGHMDGLYEVSTPESRVRFGVEFKTINENGYGSTRNPHAKHLMQGTVYQACLDLPVMLFLYYNKNNSAMAEFTQVFDEERWEAVKTKLNYVRNHALNSTIPDREVSMSCNYCKYKGICAPPRKTSGPHKSLQIRR